MTIEQVAAIGGKFYTSMGREVTLNHPQASWFVPFNVNKPVMVLLKGGKVWGPRPF